MYSVNENDFLDIEFALNVVGTTELQLQSFMITGTITAEADGTTS